MTNVRRICQTKFARSAPGSRAFQFYDIYGEIAHYNLFAGYLQDDYVVATNCDQDIIAGGTDLIVLYEYDNGC
jgi:hypothetical protein